jgi:hypothetical protein
VQFNPWQYRKHGQQSVIALYRSAREARLTPPLGANTLPRACPILHLQVIRLPSVSPTSRYAEGWCCGAVRHSLLRFCAVCTAAAVALPPTWEKGGNIPTLSVPSNLELPLSSQVMWRDEPPQWQLSFALLSLLMWKERRDAVRG